MAARTDATPWRGRTTSARLLGLGTSRQIDTAVGIVMTRPRMTSEEAVASLRQASMHLNHTVHHVAAEVELTGS